jgi:RNA polymerase sigma-70 factor, ECF subfamily
VDDGSIELLNQWRAGNQEAGGELFRRYANRLIALARTRLSVRLSHRVDPEDVVQSVYRSFFAGAREGQYDLQRGADLWRLLVTITLHKVHDQVKHHTAAKRSIKAEQSFPGEDSPETAPRTGAPSPIEAMMMVDQLDQLMSCLDSLERRILELRLQGYNLQEIAGDVHLSRRSVGRVLDSIKEQLEHR